MNLTLPDIILGVLLLCVTLALVRLIIGRSDADRAVALVVLGMLFIAFCCLFALRPQHQGSYLDVALAWSLLSFAGVLALARRLSGKEGRPRDI